jgi:flagellar basal body-associated protein FliL
MLTGNYNRQTPPHIKKKQGGVIGHAQDNNINMKRKKEDYIILGLAIILALVVLGIAIALFYNQKDQSKPIQKVLTIPSPVPTSPENLPTTTVVPDVEEQSTKPLVEYDKKDSDILLDLVESRKTLSDKDVQAKAKILSLFTEDQSGYVYQTERVYIEYVNSADAFVVEIRTSDIDQAKAEAVLWLQTQGMTQDGICNYPIQFYLNYDVAQYLRDSNIIFSPLPNNCEDVYNRN